MAAIATKGKKKLSFFREVQQELKKVTWTSKEELRTCTKIVVTVTFLFGLGIYVGDLIIRSALDFISLLARWIGG